MAKSDYLENKIIDLLFRAQAFAAPATLYFALFTVAPSDSGGGTEVTGGGYARVAVTTALTAFKSTQNDNLASTGTGGQTSNTNAITFPAPTANWGTIVAIGVFDAATAGNLLVHSALSVNKTVNNGDAAPSFAAGAFTYQES